MVLILVGFAASPAGAATTAAGPYYANPSWDQQLPASTRFVVLSNWIDPAHPSGGAAVLDRETGLVWEQSPLAPCLSAFCSVPDPGTRNWYDAQRHCHDLRTGGRLGWRLPTLQELTSLVDGDPANTSSPRLPPGHPFNNVQSPALAQSSYYWSASTFAGNASASPGPGNASIAWDVRFSDGIVSFVDKSVDLDFAWCVRGGQGVDPQ